MNRYDTIRTWWIDTAKVEATEFAKKDAEYGSGDLHEMGHTLSTVAGNLNATTTDLAYEIGVWFYVVGKVARWTAALRSGRQVSDDTLHDIVTYVKMVQYRRYEQATSSTGNQPTEEGNPR